MTALALPVATDRPDRAGLGALDIARVLGSPPPTSEQQAVIQAPLGPMLVVAGAGSGKTETMAARVVWLVANGHVEPDQVLGLTFTRKAATELAERVGRRLRRLRHAGLWSPPEDDHGAEVLGGTPTVSTYHAYAGRLVREHGLRLGHEPDSRLLSEAAAWQYASEVVGRHDGAMDDVDYAQGTVTAAVVDLAGELAEHLRRPAEVEALLDRVLDHVAGLPSGRGAVAEVAPLVARLRARRALLPLVEEYGSLKRARGAIDFADQVALAADLADRFPDIGATERQRFRVVLLDEFQDTSEAQLVMLRSLFAPRGPSDPGSRLEAEGWEFGGFPVTAVGDPHQAIYGWRGASASTLARFPREFPRRVEGVWGDAPVLQLSTSWRNDRAVLDLANRTSGSLRAASRVPVAPLRPRPGACQGQVQVARLLTVEEEAATVAGWVRRRWFEPTSSAPAREGRGSGHPPQAGERHTGISAAVLCRKRSQFGPVVEALASAGLPVEVVGLGGLLLTPEVADLLALLWVVHDPERGDQLMRLLAGPVTALGAADLEGLAEWARELAARWDGRSAARFHADPSSAAALSACMVEALTALPDEGWTGPEGCRISPAGLARLARLGGIVASLRPLAGLPLDELAGEAERALGLDVEVLARAEHTSATARAHLDAFADVAAEFTAVADRPTLGGFLEWLEAAVEHERGLEVGRLEPPGGAVQVLTVHAAKGLEWDVVAVPGLVEGGFPARPSGAPARPDRAGPGGRWVVSPAADRGWLGGLAGLPYPLRRDEDGLPAWRWESCADRAELHREVLAYIAAGGRHQLDEERKLAYVAVTRARRDLLLTAAVWGDGATPRVTSPFLREALVNVDEAPEKVGDGQSGIGGVEVRHWEPMPDTEPRPANPREMEPATAQWPGDPMRARRAELAEATALVQAEMSRRREQDGAGWAVPEPDALSLELDLLLREHRGRAGPQAAGVRLPSHLSASDLVAFAEDPDGFAVALRRPVPQAPTATTRRGTAFHGWVEQHFARASIVDLDELPGAADRAAGVDADLPVLRERFLMSEWADRVPIEVELSVETVIDGVPVRGRIDAVFPDGPERVVIVDWKTGAPPAGRRAEMALLQLATYRLAFAGLRGMPPERVRACFYYAATGLTVSPALPGQEVLSRLLRRMRAD